MSGVYNVHFSSTLTTITTCVTMSTGDSSATQGNATRILLGSFSDAVEVYGKWLKDISEAY